MRYQAVAFDNKTPDANETDTPERRIRIVTPEPVNPAASGKSAQPNDQKNAGGKRRKDQSSPMPRIRPAVQSRGTVREIKISRRVKTRKPTTINRAPGGQSNNQGDANQKPLEDQQAGGGQGQGQNSSQDGGNQSENQSGDNNGGLSKNSGNNSSGKSSKSSGGKSNSGRSNSQQNSNSAHKRQRQRQHSRPAKPIADWRAIGQSTIGGPKQFEIARNQSAQQQSAGQGQFAVGRFVARGRRLAAK